jgi:hypothetical protein
MLWRGKGNQQMWRTNHAEHTSLPLGVRGQAMTIAALKPLCSRIPWCDPVVLESALELALEIAREGREGRRIGTLFTLGKADAVLAASRALILDPLAGHAPARTHIADPDLRGTMKELAQLDGAFVISEDGTLVAACLAVAEPNDRQPRERLRYVSGWFCNNATCEYRELAR